MKLARDLDVIVLAARPFAQRVECEPHDVLAAAAVGDGAVRDPEGAAAITSIPRDGEEGLRQTLVGTGHAVQLKDRRALELAQSIVHAVLDLEYVDVSFDQRDRRQKTLALQAVAIQIAGRDIRCQDERDAAPQETFEKRAEQHRVGDVGDEEFIETQNACAARDAVRDDLERIRASGRFRYCRELVLQSVEEGAAERIEGFARSLGLPVADTGDAELEWKLRYGELREVAERMLGDRVVALRFGYRVRAGVV